MRQVNSLSIIGAVIKTVTYRSSEDDIEVVGPRRGWEGLTHLNPDDPASRRRYVIPLDRENTRTIDRRGGTVLHSSRTIVVVSFDSFGSDHILPLHVDV